MVKERERERGCEEERKCQVALSAVRVAGEARTVIKAVDSSGEERFIS